MKLASALVQSHDLIVYEDLQVKNLVKNHCLAKSINDASWGIFTNWVDYYAKIQGIVCLAVAPQYTSINCSSCGKEVQKTLSTRTHKCLCGLVLNRDHNAALNILAKGLEMLGIVLPNTVGRTEINAWGETNLCLIGATQLDKLIR